MQRSLFNSGTIGNIRKFSWSAASLALLVSATLATATSAQANSTAAKKKCVPTIYIISAPSGTGKTTMMNGLMAKNPGIAKLVSVTTRQPRKTEKKGVDYKFISVSEYNKLAQNGRLFEQMESLGNKYGILNADLEGLIDSGHDIILDMNVPGTKQFVSLFEANEKISSKANLVTIYIMPPSIAEIRSRLVKRGTDSEKIINDRMAEVMEQLKGFEDYDYILTGAETNEVLSEAEIIYKANSLRKDSCKKGEARMASIAKEYASMKR